jgi:hypothetical protein
MIGPMASPQASELASLLSEGLLRIIWLKVRYHVDALYLLLGKGLAPDCTRGLSNGPCMTGYVDIRVSNGILPR